MGFRAFRGDSFNYSHENKIFNLLHDILKEEWEDKEELLYLLGNFFVFGKELDALIIKHNAIIVIDFKNYGGKLKFSENSYWECDDIEVKGGGSKNPFIQLRTNKFALLEKLNGLSFLSAPNLGHIAGLVIFHQSIEFDETEIPQNISSWFHICDINRIIRTIDSIVSTQINLSISEIELIINSLEIEQYFPDGKAKLFREKNDSVEDKSISHTLTTDSQKLAFNNFKNWLDSDTFAFIIKGMSGTGKKELLGEILELESLKGNVILIAPNSRLANYYTRLTTYDNCESLYQLLYNKQKSGEITKSNGVILDYYPIKLNYEKIEDKILIIVESHLVSNNYYDMGNSIYGSGRIVDDLLSVLALEKKEENKDNKFPKLLIIGDQYQFSRGGLEESLLSANIIRNKGLSVEEFNLDQQVDANNPKDLYDFRVRLAEKMELSQFNQLPQFTGNAVSLCTRNSTIGRDITAYPFYSVYLVANNEIAQKINFATKEKILNQKKPYELSSGDLVDFHSMYLNKEDESDETKIGTGEIIRVNEVYEEIDIIEKKLKGRNTPTVVKIGYFSCEIRKEEIKIPYIIDYLLSDKPELTSEQLILIRIEMKERALNEVNKKCPDIISKLKALEIKLEEYKYNLNSKSLSKELNNLKELIKKMEEGEQKKEYEEKIRLIEEYKYKKNEHKKWIDKYIIYPVKVRYAYSMTVHRAQGRKWGKVYLNAAQSYNGDSIANDSYFRFLYTASICTDTSLNILRYPNLTPFYQAEIYPNKNCKIEPITINKGFYYEIPEENEINNFNYPLGFKSNVKELKAICLNVSRKLKGSNWQLSEVKQYNYQELYKFENSIGKMINVRFTYDKNYIVKKLTFLEEFEEPILVAELKGLLDTGLSILGEKRLDDVVQAVYKSLEKTEYELFEIKQRSEWELLVGITNNYDAIKLKVYVGKDGLVSKIVPEKASSTEIINFFIGFFRGISNGYS